MNSLWTRDPLRSEIGYEQTNGVNHYEADTTGERPEMYDALLDCSGCPSLIHFGGTAYTLGFGHLFSGNLRCCQLFNPIRQCLESCAFEVSECYSDLSNTNHVKHMQEAVSRLSQQKNTNKYTNPVTNHILNQTIQTIHETMKDMERQRGCCVPSLAPYGYSSVIDGCNENSITAAAKMLERAANAMTVASNAQQKHQ